MCYTVDWLFIPNFVLQLANKKFFSDNSNGLNLQIFFIK